MGQPDNEWERVMIFEIKNQWTGNVQAKVDIGAEFDGRPFGIRLGAAVLALPAHLDAIADYCRKTVEGCVKRDRESAAEARRAA